MNSPPVATSPPARSDEQGRELIRQCMRIALIYDEVMPAACHDVDLRRCEEVNPWYCRTTTGLYLEVSSGVPCRLWTPWGAWAFRGDCMVSTAPVDAGTRAMLERLSVRMHSPRRADSDGWLRGPVYAIDAIDGESIEPPGTMDPGPCPLDTHDPVLAQWKRLGGPHLDWSGPGDPFIARWGNGIAEPLQALRDAARSTPWSWR